MKVIAIASELRQREKTESIPVAGMFLSLFQGQLKSRTDTNTLMNHKNWFNHPGIVKEVDLMKASS